jgi:uncharacterized membrane protein YagU involved in acid resistance
MRGPIRTLIREALLAGTAAGVAMIPFAAVFRARGLRINEYGAKTLELLVGPTQGRLHYLLTLIQHLVISCVVAVPLILILAVVPKRALRLAVGLVYGAGFYLVVNSLALPFAFGDPTPWQLGFETVYPSLAVHLVYGFVVALLARPVVFARPRGS